MTAGEVGPEAAGGNSSGCAMGAAEGATGLEAATLGAGSAPRCATTPGAGVGAARGTTPGTGTAAGTSAGGRWTDGGNPARAEGMAASARAAGAEAAGGGPGKGRLGGARPSAALGCGAAGLGKAGLTRPMAGVAVPDGARVGTGVGAGVECAVRGTLDSCRGFAAGCGGEGTEAVRTGVEEAKEAAAGAVDRGALRDGGKPCGRGARGAAGGRALGVGRGADCRRGVTPKEGESPWGAAAGCGSAALPPGAARGGGAKTDGPGLGVPGSGGTRLYCGSVRSKALGTSPGGRVCSAGGAGTSGSSGARAGSASSSGGSPRCTSRERRASVGVPPGGCAVARKPLPVSGLWGNWGVVRA
jgi:hypothetical protein